MPPQSKQYTVKDSQTGRTVTFDWHGDQPPTDADMEDVFKAAAQHQPQQPASQSWLGGLANNALENLKGYARIPYDLASLAVPENAMRAATNVAQGVKTLAPAAAYATTIPALNPGTWSNPATVNAGQAVMGGVKQAAKDNLTPEGWYTHPVDALVNAISLGAFAAPRAAALGARMEQGGTNLLAHTLGSPVTDKADLLQSARTLLENGIPRTEAGQAQLAGQIAPLAAEKQAALAAAPKVKVKPQALQNLNDLVATTTRDTPNTSKPLAAAAAQRDRVLSDPNLFTSNEQAPAAASQTQAPLSDADLIAQYRAATAAGQRPDPKAGFAGFQPASPAAAPSTPSYTPRSVPLSYIEELKQNAAKNVAQAKGWTPGEDVSNEMAARRALADDWRNIVATVNPRVGQLNEQLAPLYSAQDQLRQALERTAAPHYGSIPGIVGAGVGGTVGHFFGHPLIGTGAGAAIGASFATNPYQLLGNTAQRTFNAGRRLNIAGNALTLPGGANLALDAAGVRGLDSALRPSTPEEEERARQLQQALALGRAIP